MGFFDKFKKEEDMSLDNDPFSSSSNLGLGPNQPSTSPPPLMDDPQDLPPPSMPQHSSPYDYQQQKTPVRTYPQQPEFSPQGGFPQTPTQNSTGDSRDIQLILAKLDAIKSELDSIHQRVRKIEHIADSEQQAASDAQPQKPRYGRW